MRTRQEQIQYAKARALQYVESGLTQQAFDSMASDLRGHPETCAHPAIQIGFQLLLAGHLDTAPAMRKFILGFQ
jgi:hypothetical protein